MSKSLIATLTITDGWQLSKKLRDPLLMGKIAQLVQMFKYSIIKTAF